MEKEFELELKKQQIEITEELLNPDNGKAYLKAKERFKNNYNK